MGGDLERIAKMRGSPCMVHCGHKDGRVSNAILKGQDHRTADGHDIIPRKPMHTGFVNAFKQDAVAQIVERECAVGEMLARPRIAPQ